MPARVRIICGTSRRTLNEAELAGEPVSTPSDSRDNGDYWAMSETVEFAIRAVLIGAGATMVMDLWAVLLRQFGVPSLNLAFLGRWIGHLPRGRWVHLSIARATPVRMESWIGWCAHYSIGITFSALLLWTYGVEWARSPSLPPALSIGIGTVVAPLLILQPGMGAGIVGTIFASRQT